MSLLSRFRKSVLPSSSRGKKVNETVEDDIRYYNYRKPTKNFIEKSIKSKTSQLNSPHDRNHYDAKEKSTKNVNIRPSKPSKNKSTNNKTDNSMNNVALSRSDTFTLEEEANLHNGTYTRSPKKEKSSTISRYRESNAPNSYDVKKGKKKHQNQINFVMASFLFSIECLASCFFFRLVFTLNIIYLS